GSDTGAANGFRITATDDDGNGTDAAGLSALAFDPPSGTAMVATQQARDLEGLVNGSTITSASNTLENLVEGVTLTVNKETGAPVKIGVASDTDALKTMVQQFVSAYNEASRFLRDQTSYNADSKTSGALQGDRTAVALLNRLRALQGTA